MSRIIFIQGLRGVALPKMTVESLAKVGVEVIFEGTAPVGDKAPDFEGADDEFLIFLVVFPEKRS